MRSDRYQPDNGMVTEDHESVVINIVFIIKVGPPAGSGLAIWGDRRAAHLRAAVRARRSMFHTYYTNRFLFLSKAQFRANITCFIL